MAAVGGVVVPDELRIAVFNAIVSEARRRHWEDGGAPLSGAMQQFLLALRRDEIGEADHPSSARGSDSVEVGKVLTVDEVAERIGCSTRHARNVVNAAGGTKQGRDWGIAESALTAYMTERQTR